jgi:hypothetical protein
MPILAMGSAQLASTTGIGVDTLWSRYYRITFSPQVAFATPAIVATVHGTAVGAADNYAVAVSNASRSGFDARVTRVDALHSTWGQSLFLNWIAYQPEQISQAGGGRKVTSSLSASQRAKAKAVAGRMLKAWRAGAVRKPTGSSRTTRRRGR